MRLNPVVLQNVVTYAAIVSAPNEEFALKPGMTANLSVEVARRDDVLRVPSAALRFKPAAEVLAKFAAPAAQSTDRQPAAKPAATSGKPVAAPDRGTVWVFEGEVLREVPVRVGITDGTFTEIIDAALDAGTTLATKQV